MGSPLFPHKYAQVKHLGLTSAVFGVKEFAFDEFDLFWTVRLVSGVVEISREVLFPSAWGGIRSALFVLQRSNSQDHRRRSTAGH